MSRLSTARELLWPGSTAVSRLPTELSDRHHRPDAALAYGPHPLQQADLFTVPGSAERPRPLVVFIHGGAWRFGDKARRLRDRKAAFCHREGWHFASVNFRMVPEVGVAGMVADIANALRRLAGEPAVDARRIVAMGHSSGAQLAALLATDPALRCPPLAGVIANDGAAFEPREPSLRPAWLARRLIDPAFPTQDAAALAGLSAAHHAARSPAPPFLILHATRGAALRQAELLEQALRQGGTQVERHQCGGTGLRGHVMLSRKLGLAGFAATEIARRWLRERFTS